MAKNSPLTGYAWTPLFGEISGFVPAWAIPEWIRKTSSPKRTSSSVLRFGLLLTKARMERTSIRAVGAGGERRPPPLWRALDKENKKECLECR